MIAAKPDGLSVAIEILGRRLHGHSDKKQPLSDVIIFLGQELILEIPISHKYVHANSVDYGLSVIIEACFVNDSAKDNAKALCIKLAQAFSNYEIYSRDYERALKSLVKKQPLAFLDVFLGDHSKCNWLIKSVSSLDKESVSNPLSVIDNDLIIDWCEANPKARYSSVASAIVPYQNSKKEGVLEWTALALRIIANSPDPVVVLNEFISMPWHGSYAETMQKRLSLLSDLRNHENALVSAWACKEEKVFQQETESEYKRERALEVSRNERFE